MLNYAETPRILILVLVQTGRTNMMMRLGHVLSYSYSYIRYVQRICRTSTVVGFSLDGGGGGAPDGRLGARG